jgi:beta-glucosidase
VVPLFEKFVRRAVEALKEYASLWVTINEPNIYALSGYANGVFPPGMKDIKTAVKVEANMARAHAAAYRTIHELQPEARAGYALHYRPMTARIPWWPLDAWMRNLRYEGVNMAFPTAISTGVMKTPVGRVSIPEARGTQDYLGINYYSVDRISFDLRFPGELFTRSDYPEGSDFSDNRFIANIPEGLFQTLQWAGAPRTCRSSFPRTARGCGRPNAALPGAAYSPGLARRQYNWPVKGYFHWSLVDNFSGAQLVPAFAVGRN